MSNDMYLLSVSVTGIKNIEKEVSLQFYKKGVDKDFDPTKYRIKAIYGENGAGKSAIITAVDIFGNILFDDSYLANPENQRFLDALINKKTKSFRFECETLFASDTENKIFRYCIEIKKNLSDRFEITHEKMEVKSGNYVNNNYKDVFIANNGVVDYVLGTGELKDKMISLSTNLLKYQTFISIFIHNLNLVNDLKLIDGKDLLISCLSFMLLSFKVKVYLGEEDRHELYFAKKRLYENLTSDESSEIIEQYNRIIKGYISVNETIVLQKNFEKYKKKVDRLCRFIKLFKQDLINIEIDKTEDGKYYRCELVLDYGEYKIAREFESTGIKKLIRLYDSLDFATDSGIVFIDEMDSNINDVYLCKLIEFFMYYGKGQLCFTTHNIDPMSVLQENKKSIVFLSNDNVIIPWTSNGNNTPEKCYKNGLIKKLPFNIDPADFIGILGVE